MAGAFVSAKESGPEKPRKAQTKMEATTARIRTGFIKVEAAKTAGWKQWLRGRYDSETGLWNQGIRPELFAKFNKRFLGGNPKGVFADGVHGLRGVVADEVKTFADNHEGFETRSDPVASELKITDLIFIREQSNPQLAGIFEEILFETFFARPDVGQRPALLIGQGNDRPFVKNGLLIPGMHLLGAT
jgi:hypothetical protein